MDADHRSILSPRLVVGLAILAFGAILLLDNLNLVEGRLYLDWLLPVAVLALSASCLLQGRRCLGWALVWGVVGVLLVANRLGAEIDLHVGRLLGPAILILLGVVLVRRSLGRSSLSDGVVDSGSTVDTFAALAGNEVKSASQEFRGGNAAAFMGGCKIDLRQARTVKPGAVLDVLAFWGGIEIAVPPDWRVNGRVVPLLGAYEDKTHPVPGEAGGELTIRGFAVMGGVDVTN